MGKAKVLRIWLVLLASLLFLQSPLLWARMLILDNVKIHEKGKCAFIRVEFRFPMRYINHFPHDSGDDLRIRIEPVAVNQRDKDAVFTRESFRPPPNDIASLLDVVYEGNIESGPFLSLFFSRPVLFEVEQGTDFRCMIIVVHDRQAPVLFVIPVTFRPTPPRYLALPRRAMDLPARVRFPVK